MAGTTDWSMKAMAVNIDTSEIEAATEALAELGNAIRFIPNAISHELAARADISLRRMVQNESMDEPRRYWHLYEPESTGVDQARLFDLVIKDFRKQGDSIQASLRVNFRENSKKYARPDPNLVDENMSPGEDLRNPMREPFRWQAPILELEETSVIYPKYSKTLVWWGKKKVDDVWTEGWVFSKVPSEVSHETTHHALTDLMPRFETEFYMEIMPVLEDAYNDGARAVFERKVREKVVEFARAGRSTALGQTGITKSGRYIYYVGAGGGQAGRFEVDQVMYGDFTYGTGEELAEYIIQELREGGEMI